ncbi:MAG: tetratricopeptide repeat protein, partial [Bryobacteraceae bacterium]
KQYDDAAQAFDAVVERFPRNEKTCDAMYMKGVELMKADNRRTDAAGAFKDYVKACPGDANIAKAKSHLRSLGMPAPKSRRRK